MITRVTITLSTPDVGDLDDVVRALRGWQHDASPIQLHPGPLGWYWQFGAAAIAVRTWSRDGQLLAIGFLDGPGVLRITVAPQIWHEEELAHQVIADVSDPQRGVLPAGRVSIESPDGTRVRDLLSDVGWNAGEPWTPLRRELTVPVERSGLRVEVTGPRQVPDFTAVHRSAWGSPRFTDELWHVMAAGLPYTDARSAYEAAGRLKRRAKQ